MSEHLLFLTGVANRTTPKVCMCERAPACTKCSSSLCEELATRQFIDSEKAKRNKLELHPLCPKCADLKTVRIYVEEGDLCDALELMNAKKAEKAEKKANGQ